jgi:hypothetical protein
LQRVLAALTAFVAIAASVQLIFVAGAGAGARTTTTTSTTAKGGGKATTTSSTSTSTSTSTTPTTAAPTTTTSTTTTSTTTVPPTSLGAVPLVGVNEQWDTQADLDQFLTSADLATLATTGARAVRVPVKCFVVKACTYTQRFDDTIDYRTTTTWDFTQLDRAVAHLLASGYTPVIGLHPGDRMWRPGWIIDDPMWESTRAYVQQVSGHLFNRFGPLAYSMFETELNTSMDTVGTQVDGVYHYTVATGFSQWAPQLSALYGGNVASLNAAYGSAYTAFDQVPVPSLGSTAGIPAGTTDSARTTDLRRVIGRLSAARYSALGDVVHAASAANEFWGPTVQLPSFHDRRQVHTTTVLTPVGPTLSDLASQPGIDVLSVDGYRNDDRSLAAAEWQVASKLAVAAHKLLAITEIGATSASELTTATAAVRAGASNLRAVFVWEGKDRTTSTSFGLLDPTGTPKPGRLDPVTSLFSAVTTDPAYRTYRTGTEAVYYPEWAGQVVQHGKLTFTKPLTLMADLLAAGIRPEPVVDNEILSGKTWPRLTTFSLYVGDAAARKLHANGQRLVGLQFASVRSDLASNNVAPDLPLYTSRFGFTVTKPETVARVAELVTLDSLSVDVTGSVSLAGWPFVRVATTGTAATPWGTHALGGPLGVRATDGSVWLDEYPGPGAIPALYGG